MCSTIVEEIKAMMSVAEKLLDTSMKVQRNRYITKDVDKNDHH